MKYSTLVFVIPVFLFNMANAGTVNQSAVTTFQNGTPADAVKVNDNFTALINAINDNASRLAALEEGNSITSSVSGRTYSLKQMGVMYRGLAGNTGFATVGNTSQSYTVTFNANGSFTFTGVENEGELNINSKEVNQFANNSAVNESGTYTQTGSTVTLSIGVSATVSLDGSVMVINDFGIGPEEDNANVIRAESSLLVGVRTQ